MRRYSEIMARDWDCMAEDNAAYYILTAPEFSRRDAVDKRAFIQSGVNDVDDILASLHVRSDRNARVLDVGCGIGRLTAALSERFGEVVGADVSSSMIRQANSLFPHLRFVHTNGIDLRVFREGDFNIVFSFLALQHLPSEKLVLGYIREFARVLKPGGLMIFQTATSFYPKWKRAYWNLLRKKKANRNMERKSFIGNHISAGKIQQFANRLGLCVDMVLFDGSYGTYFRISKRRPESIFEHGRQRRALERRHELRYLLGGR